jgi:hypothetical protein
VSDRFDCDFDFIIVRVVSLLDYSYFVPVLYSYQVGVLYPVSYELYTYDTVSSTRTVDRRVRVTRTDTLNEHCYGPPICPSTMKYHTVLPVVCLRTYTLRSL